MARLFVVLSLLFGVVGYALGSANTSRAAVAENPRAEMCRRFSAEMAKLQDKAQKNERETRESLMEPSPISRGSGVPIETSMAIAEFARARAMEDAVVSMHAVFCE